MKARRALALVLFVVGLALAIRLAVLSLSPERPASATPAALLTGSREPAASERAPSATPTTALASPTQAGPAPSRVTGGDLTPSAPPTALAATPSAPSTASIAPTSTATLSATRGGSPLPTPESTAPSASPTPDSSPSASTPARPGATATPRPQIVNNAIDPPWWPCARGEVKGLVKLRLFYPPDHPGYSRVYAGVSCFASAAAAGAAGYSKAPR